MKKLYILFIAAVAVVMGACNKDAQEMKLVPSDGTLTYFFYESTSTTSGGTTTYSQTPVPGVTITLQQGGTYTSDANGLLSITLPTGDYFYKITLPSTHSFNSYSGSTSIDNSWSTLRIPDATTTISEQQLYKKTN
jgi:hypothetical protein